MNPATNETQAADYLQRLESQRFYGTVELRYEDGKLVHLVEHRSLKPSNLSDKLRGNHERTTR
jgi:antitoxin component YwqK of YwqJK toxin-antitoxin module